MRHGKGVTRLTSIINITPDSFSGDGTLASNSPLTRANTALHAGADMLDIGAQSTRPGADVIEAKEEIARLSPYLSDIATLCRRHHALCSVDTYHADTAAFALDCGAHVINDVSAGLNVDGTPNHAMLRLIAARPDISYIFMHHVTVPADVSRTLPEECDTVREILAWRDVRIRALEQAGIARTALLFDPGIGFGKTAEQSWDIMDALPQLCAHDVPVMIGHSRKSFLGNISGEPDAAKRDPETLAASLYAAQHGAAWLRVHAINEHARALQIYHALTHEEDT